jgi:hypothetical protein
MSGDKLWVELRHLLSRKSYEGTILRRQHFVKGWTWVWYNRRRFQVFYDEGRVEYIDLDCPLPERLDSH